MKIKRKLSYTLLGVLFMALSSCGDDETTTPDELDCTSPTSIFTINLDPAACSIDIQTSLSTTSQYDESVDGATRTIIINGIANHNVGTFPNSGNPNTISASSQSFTTTTTPSLASSVTNGQGFTFGVLFSGVAADPYTAEFFTGTNGTNMAWNITTLQTDQDLGLDCNNAHVQPTGRYHYHGTPSAYLDNLGIDGSSMVKVGYAGDGFPIYYRYGYDDASTSIVEFTSGYALKTVERGGDGSSAPDGCPTGLYFQDYEYVSGTSSLDECNGRTGKTPDTDSEYYYVITDNFPSMPLCFSGTPDASFGF